MGTTGIPLKTRSIWKPLCVCVCLHMFRQFFIYSTRVHLCHMCMHVWIGRRAVYQILKVWSGLTCGGNSYNVFIPEIYNTVSYSVGLCGQNGRFFLFTLHQSFVKTPHNGHISHRIHFEWNKARAFGVLSRCLLIHVSLSLLQCFDGESDHSAPRQDWGLEEDSQPAG